MSPKESYLHEFFKTSFTNKQQVKRTLLVLALIALYLPLTLKHSVDITAQVIVQSRKITQGDATSPNRQNVSFIPPSQAQIETESNILRSPALIRQTIRQLRDQGEYSSAVGDYNKLVMQPVRYLTDPLRAMRTMLGLHNEPAADTELEALTLEAADALKVETLPGSNVISITYNFPDPTQGSRFVTTLLQNYQDSHQDLQTMNSTRN